MKKKIAMIGSLLLPILTLVFQLTYYIWLRDKIADLYLPEDADAFVWSLGLVHYFLFGYLYAVKRNAAGEVKRWRSMEIFCQLGMFFSYLFLWITNPVVSYGIDEEFTDLIRYAMEQNDFDLRYTILLLLFAMAPLLLMLPIYGIHFICRIIQFKRRDCLRIKWLARTAIIFPVIACIVAEVFFGAYARYQLPVYEHYYVVGGNCYSKGKSSDPEDVFRQQVPDWAEVREATPTSVFSLDLNKLDTTAYYALAEYCEENACAVDEYKVAAYIHDNSEIIEMEEGTEPECRLIDGQWYVKCTVLGTCLAYGRVDTGEAWREYESHKCEVRGGEREDLPLFDFQGGEEKFPILQRPLNDAQPTNVYSVCLTLYVCIEDYEYQPGWHVVS